MSVHARFFPVTVVCSFGSFEVCVWCNRKACLMWCVHARDCFLRSYCSFEACCCQADDTVTLSAAILHPFIVVREIGTMSKVCDELLRHPCVWHDELSFKVYFNFPLLLKTSLTAFDQNLTSAWEQYVNYAGRTYTGLPLWFTSQATREEHTKLTDGSYSWYFVFVDFEYGNTDNYRPIRWCHNNLSDKWTTKWTSASKMHCGIYTSSYLYL